MNNAEMYQKMLDNIYEGIYFVDTERKITFWNKGAERISGFTYEEMVGSFCYDNKLNHVDDFGNKLCIGGCPLHGTIQDGQMRNAEVYLHHKEGHRVPIKVRTTPIEENGKIVGAVEMFIGRSEAFFGNYELEELREIAFRDQLTKLPNRRSVEEHLERQMILAEKKHLSLGVAFLDIDFFKRVNDTYGHNVGDEVLKMVGKSLGGAIMRTDMLGRWGGEEFVCVFTDTTPDVLKIVTERLRMLTENSALRLPEGEVRVTISIGATFYQPGESMETLIGRADGLLYESKQNGRNRVVIG